ncbi:MAG: TetR/AcrR family transcriptional regulator [Cyanobacteriota bacterium]|nr:TetR/AcrR family transcriptional regulator [Cyanobacteriota bacterium]
MKSSNARSTKAKPSAPSSSKPDKAKAILAGALEVFTTHGYAAASMDRIASAAGVSKPTLYSYFQDKEGLFIATIQQLTQNSHQMLLNLPTDAEMKVPPDEVLRQMATSVLEEFSQNQPLLTLMRLVIGESERFPELAQTFVGEVQKPLLEKLAGYFASQPQLQLPDPAVAARIFAGSLVHYLIIQNVMHGSEIVPLERDRMVEGLIHLLTAAGKVE